ncbi:transcriptional regulator, DeoR family [Pseudomonas putida]|nr:transcriptional regulator, DeoR family [Pseudomonas putida]
MTGKITRHDSCWGRHAAPIVYWPSSPSYGIIAEFVRQPQRTAHESAPRQQQILELVRERGYVSIEEMAQLFVVTPQTIRRDINQLAELNLLRRYHGGAAYDSSIENTAYAMRADQMRDEKQRIADAVARQIPDHASLFINIGTTTESIARALLNHSHLKVITNNLHVAAILAAKDDFEVLVAGGTVRRDGGVVGQASVDFINQFKVDFALVGISGIDEDGSLLDFDYQEVRVSQAIIANARQVILAADSSKFGRNAMVRLGSIDLVDCLVTDRTPTPALTQLLNQNKIRLEVV